MGVGVGARGRRLAVSKRDRIGQRAIAAAAAAADPCRA